MSLMKDRVALVTGGSRGIGAATAKELARRGAHVAVSARTVSDLEHIAEKIEKECGHALIVPCDVVDGGQVQHMVARVAEEWGRIDILVNNAGMGSPAQPVDEIPPEEWDRTMAINLKSAFLCVRSVAPIMKNQGYGRIVNMSSFSGRNYSRFLGPQYAAAKAGLLGFTRQMAVELGPHGICVNAIAPNIVLTRAAKVGWEALSEEQRQKVISGIPLGRLAKPEEVAMVIAFLASDDASYINGVTLDVNGGSYMT